jgi:hypothetical protein
MMLLDAAFLILLPPSLLVAFFVEDLSIRSGRGAAGFAASMVSIGALPLVGALALI